MAEIERRNERAKMNVMLNYPSSAKDNVFVAFFVQLVHTITALALSVITIFNPMEEHGDNHTKKSQLFPSTSENNTALSDNTSVKTCSTDLNTKLVAIKNELTGEIEWNFVDAKNTTPEANNQLNTPSSYNENSDSDSINNLDGLVLPNPETFDLPSIKDNLISPVTSNDSEYKNSKLVDEEDEDDEDMEDEDDDGLDKDKKHVCPYCPSEFRIRGYLTRHMKKHATNKAYTCPFFNPTSNHKCHPNGGFSRRDTYKTHLKSRHFKYPPGTRSQERSNVGGKCGMCGVGFETNENWVELHIESGECTALPRGFIGKNRFKKDKKKMLGMISPISNGSPEDISKRVANTTTYSNTFINNTPPMSTISQTSNTPTVMDNQGLINKELFQHFQYSSALPPVYHEDFDNTFALDTESLVIRAPPNNVNFNKINFQESLNENYVNYFTGSFSNGDF